MVSGDHCLSSDAAQPGDRRGIRCRYGCTGASGILISWVIYVLLNCAFSSHASGQERAPIRETERTALLALYQSTGGSNWKNRNGWLGPPGSECKWFGVECGFDHEDGERQTVTALRLDNNNLAGALPAELNSLVNVDLLWVAGNRLSGSLPGRLLDKWQAGGFRLAGYASQFNAQIDEIIIRRRTVALCTDYEASLRPDGTLAMRSEKCRGQGQRPQVYCEIKTHDADVLREDVDRLARFMETLGFFDLQGGYYAPMTHGGTFEIEVVRRGRRQKVVDYGQYGPQRLWAVERLILGILGDAYWDTIRGARDCGFTVRDQ